MAQLARKKKTNKLFMEWMTRADVRKGTVPKYTLNEYEREWSLDGNTYPSLYEIYMQATDEYEFVCDNMESQYQWDKLVASPWFKEGHQPPCKFHRGIKAWRQDMVQRDKSIAKKTLIEKAMAGNASAATALANLAKGETAHTKGRPREEDLVKAAQAQVDDEAAFADDISRLNVVKLRIPRDKVKA